MSKLQVGIIGIGRIGRVHAQSICNYVHDAVVKTVADPFMTKETAIWLENLGIKNTTKDYHDIISDPEIAAVLICSSTDTHSGISIEAIRAGKHVFCEKPVDHDISKIEKVRAALSDSPVKYQVGFNRRFDHNFSAMHEAIVAGKIGKTEIVKITSRDPAPPGIDYVKVSGGMFLDMTIHDFDMVRFLTGSEVEEVYVQSAVLVDPAIGAAGDVDTAVVTMKLSNGAVAVIDNSRRSAYGYDQRAEVFGSKGMLAVGNDTLSSCSFAGENGVTSEKPMYFFLERYMQAYAKEITAFMDAVVHDTPTPVNLVDGLNAVLIGKAAALSVKEHRPVRISEIG
jgi:myo-inositol 2-dehydrogenase / D-chiro-inositol 1-dehydrogenase